MIIIQQSGALAQADQTHENTSLNTFLESRDFERITIVVSTYPDLDTVLLSVWC